MAKKVDKFKVFPVEDVKYTSPLNPEQEDGRIQLRADDEMLEISTKKVWLLECEAADSYYGWNVESIWEDEFDAHDEMDKQKGLNRGCTFQVREETLHTRSKPVEKRSASEHFGLAYSNAMNAAYNCTTVELSTKIIELQIALDEKNVHPKTQEYFESTAFERGSLCAFISVLNQRMK